MKGAEGTAQSWAIAGLLAALVATNVLLGILLRTGGPLVGAAAYAVLLALTWRGRPRDYRAATVGGLVGLAVHVVEVAVKGWSARPIWMALNLILPAALAPLAWWAGRAGRQARNEK